MPFEFPTELGQTTEHVLGFVTCVGRANNEDKLEFSQGYDHNVNLVLNTLHPNKRPTDTTTANEVLIQETGMKCVMFCIVSGDEERRLKAHYNVEKRFRTKMKEVKLYHATSLEGIAGIVADGGLLKYPVIPGRDKFGKGIYYGLHVKDSMDYVRTHEQWMIVCIFNVLIGKCEEGSPSKIHPEGVDTLINSKYEEHATYFVKKPNSQEAHIVGILVFEHCFDKIPFDQIHRVSEMGRPMKMLKVQYIQQKHKEIEAQKAKDKQNEGAAGKRPAEEAPTPQKRPAIMGFGQALTAQFGGAGPSSHKPAQPAQNVLQGPFGGAAAAAAAAGAGPSGGNGAAASAAAPAAKAAPTPPDVTITDSCTSANTKYSVGDTVQLHCCTLNRKAHQGYSFGQYVSMKVLKCIKIGRTYSLCLEALDPNLRALCENYNTGKGAVYNSTLQTPAVQFSVPKHGFVCACSCIVDAATVKLNTPAPAPAPVAASAAAPPVVGVQFAAVPAAPAPAPAPPAISVKVEVHAAPASARAPVPPQAQSAAGGAGGAGGAAARVPKCDCCKTRFTWNGQPGDCCRTCRRTGGAEHGDQCKHTQALNGLLGN